MITNHACSVCGWPHLEEPQRSIDGGVSEEICVCCGFQSGYSDDDQGISVEEWRRRWVGSGSVFAWPDDDLPPERWGPAAQLQALLTAEPSPVPYLPDNPILRAALSAGDVEAAAGALAAGTVVLAMTGSGDHDPVVLVELSDGGRGLLIFTGPESWGSWVRRPEAPSFASAIEGSNLLATAEAQLVDQVVVDLDGPASVSMTLDQLRALVALVRP